jgi:hypothetical protein
MSDDRIEGFVVGGTMQLTVANVGHCITVSMKNRTTGEEVALSVEQSRRLRRLLAAAERRAV